MECTGVVHPSVLWSQLRLLSSFLPVTGWSILYLYSAYMTMSRQSLVVCSLQNRFTWNSFLMSFCCWYSLRLVIATAFSSLSLEASLALSFWVPTTSSPHIHVMHSLFCIHIHIFLSAVSVCSCSSYSIELWQRLSLYSGFQTSYLCMYVYMYVYSW